MKKIIIMLLFASSLSALPLQAADLRWSGFGSIISGKTIDDEPLPGGQNSTYKPDAAAPNVDNAYYDNIWSLKPDTLFGIQVDVDLNNQLSVTTQLVSKGAKNYDTEIEWLYAGYELTPKLLIKFGKQRLPLYNYSDFQDVGYAYHWTRPPLEVYGEELSSYEGISILYTDSFGDWDYDTQLYWGNTYAGDTPLGDVHLKDVLGTVLSITNDEIKYRFSAHRANAWTDGETGLATVVDKDSPSNAKFYSGGVFYDTGAWLVGSEVTYMDAGLIQSDTDGGTFVNRTTWMITAAYRINDFLPHITLSKREIELAKDGTESFLISQGLNAATAAILAAPHEGAKQIAQTINIGVRWDFHPQAALKLDYTRRTDKSDDILIDGNATLPGAGKTLSVDVLALGVDFIF